MSAVRFVIESAPDDAAAGTYARIRAFDDRGRSLTEPFDLAFSVTPEDRALLRWAALEYAAWPFGGYAERARLASERAVAVGSALYNATVTAALAHTPSRLAIETTLAQALRLPWELLHDGQGFIALADPPCAIVRTAAMPTAPGGRARKTASGGAPLRVLLVTARPNDAVGVDLRLVAQKLFRRLDARIRDGAIAVEYLRPPTFDALVARLQAQPAVDVVHFDGHGTAGEIAGGTPALVFEDVRCKSVLISAERYARALADAGVGASILTACETATVTGGRVESAAAAIVDAGVDTVVAMGDEILVDSAADYADAFYAALSRGAGISAAHVAALRRLGSRQAFNADWWTPQFYAYENDESQIDAVSQADAAAACTNELAPPISTTSDCVGRGRELLAIERAFAGGSNVVLRGFAGAGKTTLAREATSWLTLTGAFAHVRVIDCGEGSRATLDALAAIADSRAAADSPERTLVIVDGIDTLDGPLDAATLGTSLERTARTSALLVTTRDVRDRPPTFAQMVPWNFITVGALAPNDALELARRCASTEALASGGVDRSAIEATIARVGGLPLGIVSQSAPDVPPGDAAFSAWASLVETSLARLAERERTMVTALREFARGGNYFIARTLIDEDRDGFASFVEELRRVGLGDSFPLTNLPEGRMLCLQLHPALMPLERMRSGFDRDLALKFARAYDALSATLAAAATADPFVPSRLYAFERPNLERAAAAYDAVAMPAEAAALRTSLDALAGQFGGHLDTFAVGPQTFEGADETLRAAREALAVAEAASPADPLGVANARVIVGIALDRAGNTPAAVDETQRAVTALSALAQDRDPAAERSARVDAGYLSALINLGGLQRKLGRHDDARSAFRSAAPIAEASDRTAAVKVHIMLGDVALSPKDATAEYGRALTLARLLAARAEEAGALFGLAGSARQAGDFAEAERKTREAVGICASIGDARRVTSGYLTLGSLAAERGAADEAERWFTTLRGSAGYAACDGRTRAFFDVSIAAGLADIVFAWLGTDDAVKTATTVPAWQAAVGACLARDREMQLRLASSRELAEGVIAEHADDPDCAAVPIGRKTLAHVALMEATRSVT
ncbi:MAG: CHAT domain-containing protein [Candidatus Eremiobacteraeota bacterium]|nr:CHAT domain-containing protein [Candidatus Eremiobacteraeota bacterium]